MNLFTPERIKDESYEDYSARRKRAHAISKLLERGAPPTRFVQHYNPIKNPNPRGKFVRVLRPI